MPTLNFRCRGVALFGSSAASLLLASACGSAPATSVSLATLATNSQRYTGAQVSTRGVVQRFVDPSGPYFVLQDAQEHRVELLPSSRVSPDVGRQIEVTGTFNFSPDSGRFIDVQEVVGE